MTGLDLKKNVELTVKISRLVYGKKTKLAARFFITRTLTITGIQGKAQV